MQRKSPHQYKSQKYKRQNNRKPVYRHMITRLNMTPRRLRQTNWSSVMVYLIPVTHQLRKKSAQRLMFVLPSSLHRCS
uniref:Uncharacterized protein n=1 Tax=Escherichia coli TaxID=562 RepID=A0A3L0W6N7_ECOLX